MFNNTALLSTHINSVHVVDNRKCEVCGGTYKNKYSLSKHMKNAHFGTLSSTKTGKGSYRMSNTPTPRQPVHSPHVVEPKYEEEDQSPRYSFPHHPMAPPMHPYGSQ